VAAAACAGASTAVAGFEARSSTGVAANRQSPKVRFTANLPKKETPCGDIESQVAEKVAGIVLKSVPYPEVPGEGERTLFLLLKRGLLRA
jgi:hypothetical protein